MASGTANNAARVTESDIFRDYYTDNDYFLSPEGILKVISAEPRMFVCPGAHACLKTLLTQTLVYDNDLSVTALHLMLICVAVAVVFISGGLCDAPGMLTSTITIMLVCGAALSCLYAGVVLDVPKFAPQSWLYTDIIVSAVTGVLMLVIGLLSMTLCGMASLINNLFSPLVLINAALVTGSAVVTYARVMRRWDAARAALQPRPSAPIEQDV